MQRPVSVELAAALRRARLVEAAASGRRQRSAAIDATATLILAAQRAGWTGVEIARAAGMDRSTVQDRLRRGRARRLDHGGLEIRAPPVRVRERKPDAYRDHLVGPPEQRVWLSITEAAAYAGRTRGAISQWHTSGLLPKTWKVRPLRWLYSKYDLQRVDAPLYNGLGPDRAAVVALIAEDNSPTPGQHGPTAEYGDD